MEEEKEATAVFCPECGQRVTEEDKKRENVKNIDGKTCHKKCRLIRK